MSKKVNAMKVPHFGEWKINLDAMEKMEFGFFGLDQGYSLAQLHPKLKDIKSWVVYAVDPESDVPPNNLFAYILFLYSPDSPVNNKFGTPLLERKTQALLLSGFSHLRDKEGVWNVDIISYLIELRADVVVGLIVDYLKFLNEPIWREMKTLEQELEEGYRLRMRPVNSIDDKNTLQAYDLKGKARKEAKDIIEQYKVFARQFYGEAHANELDKKVHQMMTTVESHAKQLGED